MYVIYKGHLYRQRNNKVITCTICCTTSMILFLFKNSTNRLLLHTSMHVHRCLIKFEILVLYINSKYVYISVFFLMTDYCIDQKSP